MTVPGATVIGGWATAGVCATGWLSITGGVGALGAATVGGASAVGAATVGGASEAGTAAAGGGAAVGGVTTVGDGAVLGVVVSTGGAESRRSLGIGSTRSVGVDDSGGMLGAASVADVDA